MIIFYDPSDGQVMAVYSGDTTSTVWIDRGFLRASSEIPVTRDHKVVVVDDKVTNVTSSPNPEQPSRPSDADSVEASLKKDPIWRASIKREVAQRRVAGETALTVQDVIAEYRAELP